MDKFIKTLNSLSDSDIANEVKDSQRKNSNIMNEALLKTYPNIATGNTKTRLLKIWTSIIDKAAKPREGNITRIWIKLFEALDKKIKSLYDNENTSEVMFTAFRKVLRSKFGDDSEIYKQSIYKLGVSQERSKERKAEYANKVKTRNVERKKLNPIYVEDVLELINKLKSSNDPYEKSLAVLLATGSRSIELFKVSKFYSAATKGAANPNRITVKGIAKDRGNRDYEDVVVERPLVGLSAPEVIDLTHDIRDELNLNGSNSAITNKTNVPLNKAFKKYFGKTIPDGTAHKARYIYANAAYLIYGKPEKIPYESFLQTILAHTSGESTKSYLGINVQFKKSLNFVKNVASAPDDLKQLFEAEMTKMKAKIEECCPAKVDIDLDQFKNSNRRGLSNETKINNVVEALQKIKAEGVKVNQRDLRKILGYSAAVMSAAYKKMIPV